LDRQSVGKFIDIRGIENLDRALERRGGAILCTGHIRGLFIFLVALKLLGYNVNAIRRTPKSAQGPIARWFNRRMTLVSGAWCKFLWMERDNLRVAVQAANALRRNEIILVLIDARFGNEAVEADFLNRRLPLTSGHVVLAQACRAPLLSFFVRSSDTGLPRIAEIEEPYYASDDVDASVQHCISRLERKIVDSPVDWIWFHERDVWSRQAAEASTPGRRDALT
jgi:lauroyl/myristoyl acyltransferase